MPNDVTLPPWMLWTAVSLFVGALLGLVVGVRQTRRRRPPAVPSLTFQALPGPSTLPDPPPSSGRLPKPLSSARHPKPPAFMPAPAPLASAPADSQSEKRTSFRRPGNPVLALVAAADHRPLNAWVIDRSRHGLRLATEQPLTVGQVYSVRPIQAPPAAPWAVVEVRHCKAVDAHWESGCRFLQPPPVTEPMQFG